MNRAASSAVRISLALNTMLSKISMRFNALLSLASVEPGNISDIVVN
jgi:hypothetical protein